jgi:WD40 repeat protein
VTANADGSALDLLSATTGSDVSTPIAGAISALVWAPAGDVAAYVTSGGTLGLWTPGSAPVTVATGTHGAPVWSTDGQWLAALEPRSVLSVRVTASAPVRSARISTTGDSTSLAWAPDAHILAIGGSGGVTLVAADGSQQRAVDGQPTGSAALIWTVAK